MIATGVIFQNSVCCE